MLHTLTALAALLLGAAGCARTAGPEAPPPQPQTTRWAAIVDAHAHGAIVFDGQAYRGVRRDGTTAWRRPAGERDLMAVAGAARCPDAVLSGSLRSFTDPGVPDPRPALLLDGRAHPLDGAGGHHRRVLTAAGARDFVAAVGDGDRWRLELHHGDRPPTRVPLRGSLPTWQESPGGRLALLTVTGKGAGGPGGRARWFTRQPGGWRPAGAAIADAGVDACVADDGRALLLGRSPAVLRRDGRLAPVTDLRHAGTCALAAAGGVVAELAQRDGRPQARLRAFDARGAVVWRRDVPAEVAVTADPTAARAAYLAGGALQELDLRGGRAGPPLPGVLAARYDGAGGLVTVGAGGAVTWRPTAPVAGDQRG
jgi:hypothetical protein